MSEKKLFDNVKENILNIDPVYFCENNLSLDGEKFSLHGNGYKPFADMYRYIGIKALEKNAKPIVLVKGRQVGGTTMACALEMYFMGSGVFGKNRPPVRIMHTFPHLEKTAAYSKTKLNSMINTSVCKGGKNRRGEDQPFLKDLLDTSSKTADSLHFKQFEDGNHIWIEAIGADGSRARSKTVDIVFFDEVQDTFEEAIINTTKSLSAAKYGALGSGVQVYFGTPKRKGSAFYKMWNKSSQQYYYLGCSNCNDYFPLYTPESDEWESIWLYEFTVKCPKCNYEQDKRVCAENGKWISTKNDADSYDYVGFHLNQFYMPHFTKEKLLSEKPGIHPINTERGYRNEVLGEFFQGDSSPITIEEIQENCGDMNRSFSKTISSEQFDFCVLGIDYGLKSDLEQLSDPNKNKKVGQSYSTAVVLGCKGQRLSIEFATKFKRNDIESKKGIIEQIMRQYNIDLAVGDIGYSESFSEILYHIYGNKYFISRAAGKVNNNVKFRQDVFPNEITFDKNHYLGTMFEKLKSGHIRFPFKDYDKVGWLIDHCCSMEIKPKISKFGSDPEITYQKGSSPNDGLMALLNAYLGYLYLYTKGFSLKNIQIKAGNKVDPIIITSYSSRRII